MSGTAAWKDELCDIPDALRLYYDFSHETALWLSLFVA